MSTYDPEPRRCERARTHGRHEWVTGARSKVVHQCPGLIGSARSLDELLARRPELADVTPYVIHQRAFYDAGATCIEVVEVDELLGGETYWHDRDYHWRFCADECAEGVPPQGAEVRVRFGRVVLDGTGATP